MEKDQGKDPKKKKASLFKRVPLFFLRLIRGYFVSVGIFATLMPLLILYMLSQSEIRMGLPKEKSFDHFDKVVLDLRLDRVVSERSLPSSDVFFARLVGEDVPHSLQEITLALRRAKEDIRVQGVYLEIGSLSATRAVMSELRRALVDFRSSKKALWIHMTSPSGEQYRLGSAAERLAIAESDQLMLSGPMIQLVYFKDALEKLGIEFEVVRAGKFKSALEAYVQNEPSEATLEMYRAVTNSLTQDFVDAVAPARGRTPAEVRVWLAKTFLSAKEALSSGVVDELSYAPDFKIKMEETYKDATFVELAPFLKGTADIDKPREAIGAEEIGYIEAFGTIVMDAPGGGGSEPLIAPEPMIKQIKWMAERDEVKVVVMRVVSPGGSAVASDLIWHELRKLAEKKPVVVSMGGVAASGGYYIAAPAQRILAEPTTITGSIGVIAGLPSGEAVAEKWGVHFHLISDSERKNVFDFGKALTEDDKKVLGQQIDETYQLFLQRVALGRNKSVEEIDQLGQGRVYTGSEALALGLVDQLGGLSEAFTEAKKLGGMEESRLYPLVRYKPKPTSPLECFNREKEEILSCLEEVESFVPSLLAGPKGPWDLRDRLAAIGHLFQNRQVIALWPEAYWKENGCYLPH